MTEAESTSAVFDRDADYRMAVSVAENSAVLLKERKGAYFLWQRAARRGCSLANFCAAPRYQGGGGSRVNSAKVSCALEHAPGVAPMHGATAPMGIPLILRWNRPRWPLLQTQRSP